MRPRPHRQGGYGIHTESATCTSGRYPETYMIRSCLTVKSVSKVRIAIARDCFGDDALPLRRIRFRSLNPRIKRQRATCDRETWAISQINVLTRATEVRRSVHLPTGRCRTCDRSVVGVAC